MGMVHKILSPRVQNRNETDRRTKMAWIGGDRLQRLGSGLEQNVVDQSLVLESDRRDRLGNGEYYVEIWYRQ
jgi:hypothetical protein